VTVEIVTMTNIPPVANSDDYSVNEDDQLLVTLADGVLSNDSDSIPGGWPDSLTAVLSDDVIHGNLTLHSDGSFIYVPASDYYGQDRFLYQAFDGLDYSGETLVLINIIPVNDAPVADADGPYSGQSAVSGFAEITLDGSGSYDIDGEIVSYLWTWNGNMSAEGVAAVGSFPTGITELTLTVTDNNGATGIDVSTVNVSEYINIPPVAVADTYITLEDEPLIVDVYSGIIINDIDDGYPGELTAILADSTNFGLLDYDADGWDGSFTYSPSPDFSGVDEFSYYLFDGESYSNTVIVSISVESVNDMPVAEAGGPYQSTADQSGFGEVLLDGSNSFDIDGTIVLYEWSWDENTFSGMALQASFPIGTTLVTLTVTDDQGGSGTDLALVGVAEYNNEFPVAFDDSYITDEDTELIIGADNGVLANDTDDEYPEELTAVLIDDVESGTLYLNADGSFSYIPDMHFSGIDFFNYAAYDGQTYSNVAAVEISVVGINDLPVAEAGGPYNGIADNTNMAEITLNASGSYDPDGTIDEYIWSWGSNSATGIEVTELFPVGTTQVLLTVTDNDGAQDTDIALVGVADYTNQMPVVVADEYTTNEDELLEVDADNGVLANDTDDDYPEPLTAILIDNTLYGEITLNADGSFAYMPELNYNGSDYFSYSAFDGQYYSVVATVTINVANVNDAPVLILSIPDQFLEINFATFEIDLSNHFYDIDGDDLSYSIDYDQNIVLIGEEDDTMAISSIFDIYGNTEVVITANDTENRATVSDTFLVTITSVSDDYYDTYEDTELNVSAAEGVLANDYFFDFITNFYVYLNQDVSNGSLILNSDGSFIYTPDADYFGEDTFQYIATDGYLTSGVAVVTINVVPINDDPIIDLPDIGFSFFEDTIYQEDFAQYIFDVDNSELSLSYSGNEYIQIYIADLVVTFDPDDNYNGTENITFTVNDNTGRAIDSETVPVTVFPVNDAPVVEHPIEDFSFNEDTQDSQLSLNYTFDDIDNEVLTFDVSDNINLLVDIDDSGMVIISSYEENWNGSETIIFSAADLEYTVFDTVIVTVLPVNDPPYITELLPDFELIEDFDDITIDLDIHFFDVDDDLYYSVQFDNDNVLLGINDNLMSIISVPNWTGITEVIISAQDDFYTRYTIRDTFLITVLGENDPPVLLVPLPDVVMQEDAAPIQRELNYYFADYDQDHLDYSIEFIETEMTVWITDDILYFEPVSNWFGFTSITVTASDTFADISDVFDVTVEAVNDAPYVYFEMPDITLEESFTAFDVDLYSYFADIDNEILYFTVSMTEQDVVIVDITNEIMTISSQPEWNGTVDITITAQDDVNSLRLITSDTFTINVIPVNDSPYLATSINDYIVQEDFDSFDIDLDDYFADPENDILTYSVFHDDDQIAAIINDNLLSISSVFNWFGTSQITINASDGVMGNDIAEDQFDIIVQSVNDVPFVEVPIEDYNVQEDFAVFMIDLNDHFTDYDDILSFTVQYNADLIQASVDLGLLSIVSLPDVSGDAELLITASDIDNEQISDSFWIYIQPVNDAPVMTLPTSIEFFEDAGLELDFANYIVDVDSEVLLLTSTGNTNIMIDINDLIVSFSNILNWNGSEIITFHVYDGEFIISAEVQVVVLPQADELTLNLPISFTFDEDDALSVDFAAFISNPDGFVLELSYTGADNVMIDINGLIVDFSAEQDWNGSDMIDFTVSNMAGPESASDNVDVVIIPVNDPPTVAPISDQYILEDSGIVSLDLNDYFADVDGDILQYSAIFANDELDVEIIYPYLYLEALVDWNGTSTVIVTAQDDYERYTISDTFDVVVEPVNDPPVIVIN